MFGQLSTTFTLLAALLLAHLADANDFDWDIEPKEGFPVVAFNNSTTTSEIVFLYDAPRLYENKTYGVTVFDADCKTIGSNTITHLEDASVDRELTVLLDVDQGTISNSTYYTHVNITNAVIGLCLRVDYFLYGDSINFHETNLTINIDLTAGFNITSLEEMRIRALQDTVSSNIDFPVVAYHCNELNDKLASKPDLVQGESLQLCVEIDPTIVNEGVFVTDILSVDLDQENMDQNVTQKTIISETIPDFLTSKLCQDGICNVKTQLESRWFSDPIPGDINTTGIAILAFGSISGGSGQRLRYLRAPIVFQQSRHAGGRELDRKLQQDGDDGNAVANFILSTSLSIPSSEEKIPYSDQKTSVLLFIGVAVVVVSLVGFCCLIRWLGCLRSRNFGKHEEVEVAPNSTPTNEVVDISKGSSATEAEVTSKSELAPEKLDPAPTNGVFVGLWDDKPAQDVVDVSKGRSGRDATETEVTSKSELAQEFDPTPTNEAFVGLWDDKPAQDVVDVSKGSSGRDATETEVSIKSELAEEFDPTPTKVVFVAINPFENLAQDVNASKGSSEGDATETEVTSKSELAPELPMRFL
jgi:hypothetical protein